MNAKLLPVLSLLFVPMILPAQRCAGRINFMLRDSAPHGRDGRMVRFPDRSMNIHDSVLTSLDGRFTITSIDVEGNFGDRGEATPLLSVPGSNPYLSLRTGCGGDYLLVVVRHGRKGEPSDTMRLSFDRTCDVDFGVDIPFTAGNFRLLVCDTTRIPVDSSVSHTGHVPRPFEEQYPAMRHNGYDLTEALESAIATTGRKRGE